jgi:hypothetical protein
MKPAAALGAFVLVAALPALSRASVDPCPAATDNTIVGVWEAIDLPQAFRVFRLEVASIGLSTLTQGMPSQVAIPAFGDVVTKLAVTEGNVLIALRTTHASLIGVQTSQEGRLYVSTGISTLKGFARVCGDGHGVMDATLTLEPGSPSPRTWKLTFYKHGRGTLGDSIKAMERNAEDLANKIKRDMPASEKPRVRPSAKCCAPPNNGLELTKPAQAMELRSSTQCWADIAEW